MNRAFVILASLLIFFSLVSPVFAQSLNVGIPASNYVRITSLPKLLSSLIGCSASTGEINPSALTSSELTGFRQSTASNRRSSSGSNRRCRSRRLVRRDRRRRVRRVRRTVNKLGRDLECIRSRSFAKQGDESPLKSECRFSLSAFKSEHKSSVVS